MHSKLPHTGTTIFTVMSKMAQDHGAINLSQGFPDFDCPEALRERVTFHLNNRRNQYPPMTGVPELREQIAAKVQTLYGRRVSVDQEVTVTSGATEALFDAIQAVVHPGDEVLLFDPAYDSYVPAVMLAGGTTVRIPMNVPDYRIDWERAREAMTDRTRLVVVNSPHNPAGSVFTRDDLDQLAALTRDRDTLVLSDEVYEHMVFDGERHHSVLTHDELWPRSFAVFSFGKTYHATGWKVACCVAPQNLSTEFRKIHQFVTFTTNSFLQYAIADFLRDCPEHHLELPAFYQQKRDTFCRLLAGTRFRFTPSAGTYFQCVDYSEVSDMEDREFCNWLTQEAGVAAIPMSPFCEQEPETRIIRFCFCKDDATLESAADILRQL
ncbi:MAG: pyridoxal phosphate-dependent aminotransferase [Pseudohongiellaceae bacterium]